MSADTGLILGSGIHPLLAAGVGLGALAVVAAGYRSVLRVRDFGRWLPKALLGLRVAAVLLFVLLLLNPILRVERVPADARRVAVLVDASRSMSIRDTLGGAARAETARRILTDDRLLESLRGIARVDAMTFDAAVRPLDLEKPSPPGDATDLAGALAAVAGAKDPVPLAAVVVLTDGCETGVKSAADLPARVPVFPVGLGSVAEALAEAPDVAVAGVRADRRALLNATVEVKVDLRVTRLEGETATVEVRKDGQTLAERAVRLGKGPQEVSLAFVPREPGLQEFEARVVPHPKETVPENNARPFAVQVAAQRLRVFYYEGTPRWEYKFLTRELKADAHVALTTVLRTNVDRAYQSGTGTGSDELFPAGREGLKRYDCVVLGDVRAPDLAPAQAAALRAFVEEDGGGLVVLACRESLAPDGLAALGLETLLPVPIGGARVLEGSFDVRPTPDGVTHPATAGLVRFPPLETLFAVGVPKPGAQVLLKAQGGPSDLPLAVAQRMGAGRVFFFASDADWKWVMKHKDAGGGELFVRFWGQAIRWAAHRDTDARARAPVTIASDKEIYRLGEPVRLRVQGPDLGGIREAEVGGGETVPLKRVGDALEGSFTPKRPGVHAVKAGEAACELLVERPAGEFDRVALQEPLLRKIAAAAGGQYFDAVTARNLPEALKASGAVKMDTVEYAFAEWWLPFMLVVAALAAEWALRKRMQVM
jgi:uncharacterized membrane protein